MGTSHFKSNVEAKNGTETITGFAEISATGNISASTHVKVGAHQYILIGDVNTEASIVAVATAVDASCKGSLFMGTKGNLWFFVTDTAASPVQSLA